VQSFRQPRLKRHSATQASAASTAEADSASVLESRVKFSRCTSQQKCRSRKRTTPFRFTSRRMPRLVPSKNLGTKHRFHVSAKTENRRTVGPKTAWSKRPKRGLTRDGELHLERSARNATTGTSRNLRQQRSQALRSALIMAVVKTIVNDGHMILRTSLRSKRGRKSPRNRTIGSMPKNRLR
jgi:hypothetical protein